MIGYGGSQGKWQVSANGGQVPHWTAGGKELFYFDSNQSLLAVLVRGVAGALEFGAPHALVNQWTIVTVTFYSPSPDGKRVLMERVAAGKQADNAHHKLHYKLKEIALKFGIL